LKNDGFPIQEQDNRNMSTTSSPPSGDAASATQLHASSLDPLSYSNFPQVDVAASFSPERFGSSQNPYSFASAYPMQSAYNALFPSSAYLPSEHQFFQIQMYQQQQISHLREQLDKQQQQVADLISQHHKLAAATANVAASASASARQMQLQQTGAGAMSNVRVGPGLSNTSNTKMTSSSPRSNFVPEGAPASIPTPTPTSANLLATSNLFATFSGMVSTQVPNLWLQQQREEAMAEKSEDRLIRDGQQANNANTTDNNTNS